MKRRHAGQSLLEALVLVCLMMPLGGLLIDLALFVCGAARCHGIERASYAASKGPPDAVVQGEPKRNASDAIKSLHISNSIIAIDPDCSVQETIFTLPTQPLGGPVDGQVSVRTKCTVKMPFTDCLLRRDGTTVSATQTFAYSWIMQPNAAIRSMHSS